MNSRNQSLDVLRGIAVLMVVVDHYSLVSGSKLFVFNTLGRGVDLFFVLSGFLISGLLFSEFKKTGELNLKRFWIRRGFKIYPAFYFLMTVTAAFFFFRVGVVPIRILGDLFFVQNYAPHIWGHGWSLAVEEHFYFILPVLLWTLIRLFRRSENPFKLVPLISILVSALCFFLRVRALNHGQAYGLATHLRMDALFAGVTLGYFYHFDSASFREAKSKWILVSGLVLALLLFAMLPFLQVTFAYVASCLIVTWTLNRETSKGRASAGIAFVGRHSYSIYLWQSVAALSMARLAGRWFTFPLYVVAAIALGVGMSKLIEFPALKVREKLFPSKAVRTTKIPISVPSRRPQLALM